mmetsp:Transcript_9462/g.21639  ORF Transcript_9462/g.21639 Transcript_9462/m.21639 type:complete len:350 (-) Transcript_9462:695-1744(-)
MHLVRRQEEVALARNASRLEAGHTARGAMVAQGPVGAVSVSEQDTVVRASKVEIRCKQHRRETAGRLHIAGVAWVGHVALVVVAQSAALEDLSATAPRRSNPRHCPVHDVVVTVEGNPKPTIAGSGEIKGIGAAARVEVVQRHVGHALRSGNSAWRGDALAFRLQVADVTAEGRHVVDDKSIGPTLIAIELRDVRRRAAEREELLLAHHGVVLVRHTEQKHQSHNAGVPSMPTGKMAVAVDGLQPELVASFELERFVVNALRNLNQITSFVPRSVDPTAPIDGSLRAHLPKTHSPTIVIDRKVDATNVLMHLEHDGLVVHWHSRKRREVVDLIVGKFRNIVAHVAVISC